MLPIIDTHQHLWDLQRFRLPWLDAIEALRRSFLMADYLQATRDLNVVQSVYMEVDVDPDQQQDEAAYIVDLCERSDNPMTAAVVSGRPDSDQFNDYAAALRDNAWIKGIRRVLHTQPPGHCLQPAFIKGVRRLGEVGLSFDICCVPSELANAVKLVEACPDTRFILDHCGNASVPTFKPDQPDPALSAQARQWRDDISLIAQQPQVICKISGIVAGAGTNWTAADLAPPINHCLNTFGPNRVIFGGDWPVCTTNATYTTWVEALLKIIAPRSAADQRKLLHDNAVQCYGLD
jgi:L-fuconolactonase